MKTTKPKTVGELNIIDDPFFTLIASDIDVCEELIRTVLDDPRIKVLKNHPQYKMVNPGNRSAVLDLFCELPNKKLVNVEVQVADNIDHLRRMRFYQSLITAYQTGPGTGFDEIPDVICIYITAFDPFGLDRSVYRIKNTVEDSDIVVDNGVTEIMINASRRDGSAISQLMEIYTESEAYSERFPVTSAKKMMYKSTQKGIAMMNEWFKTNYSEQFEEAKKAGLKIGTELGLQQGREQGSIETQKQIVINCLKRNMSVEEISLLTEVPSSEIEKISLELKD